MGDHFSKTRARDLAGILRRRPSTPQWSNALAGACGSRCNSRSNKADSLTRDRSLRYNAVRLSGVSMSASPTYRAAHLVAPTIEGHFGQHLSQARGRGEVDLADAPDARAIE